MVRELIAPANRTILFLQQSSVEWCNSMFLPVVQEVDPLLHRTILVTSKFDNRLKEFHQRWEVGPGAHQMLPATSHVIVIQRI